MAGNAELASLLARIARAGEDLTAAVAEAETAALQRAPAPGEWSAWDTIFHLVSSESWFVAKACEVLVEDKAGAARRLLRFWLEWRAAAIAALAGLDAATLDQAGRLTGLPEWTPRTLLSAYARHAEEHAAQIRAALGHEAT